MLLLFVPPNKYMLLPFGILDFFKVVAVSLTKGKMSAAFGRLFTFKALFSIAAERLAFEAQVILTLSLAISFEQEVGTLNELWPCHLKELPHVLCQSISKTLQVHVNLFPSWNSCTCCLLTLLSCSVSQFEDGRTFSLGARPISLTPL